MWMDVLVLSAMFQICCPSFLGSRLFARPEARCQQVQTWSSKQDIAVMAHLSSNDALDKLTLGTRADDACPIARRSQLVPLAWQQFCTKTYRSLGPHRSEGSPHYVLHTVSTQTIRETTCLKVCQLTLTPTCSTYLHHLTLKVELLPIPESLAQTSPRPFV